MAPTTITHAAPSCAKAAPAGTTAGAPITPIWRRADETMAAITAGGGSGAPMRRSSSAVTMTFLESGDRCSSFCASSRRSGDRNHRLRSPHPIAASSSVVDKTAPVSRRTPAISTSAAENPSTNRMRRARRCNAARRSAMYVASGVSMSPTLGHWCGAGPTPDHRLDQEQRQHRTPEQPRERPADVWGRDRRRHGVTWRRRPLPSTQHRIREQSVTHCVSRWQRRSTNRGRRNGDGRRALGQLAEHQQARGRRRRILPCPECDSPVSAAGQYDTACRRYWC
mgnify:CR=1 FL=1